MVTCDHGGHMSQNLQAAVVYHCFARQNIFIPLTQIWKHIFYFSFFFFRFHSLCSGACFSYLPMKVWNVFFNTVIKNLHDLWKYLVFNTTVPIEQKI